MGMEIGNIMENLIEHGMRIGMKNKTIMGIGWNLDLYTLLF